MMRPYLPAKNPGSTSLPPWETDVGAMVLASSIALRRRGTSSSLAVTLIDGLASSPEKKVPSNARPEDISPAVGFFSPQARP